MKKFITIAAVCLSLCLRAAVQDIEAESLYNQAQAENVLRAKGTAVL